MQAAKITVNIAIMPSLALGSTTMYRPMIAPIKRTAAVDMLMKDTVQSHIEYRRSWCGRMNRSSFVSGIASATAEISSTCRFLYSSLRLPSHQHQRDIGLPGQPVTGVTV